MQQNSKRLLLLACLTACLNLFVMTAIAQFNPAPPPPTDDNVEKFDDPDQGVPIDGGLALLLAAGAGYGLKRYRTKNSRDTSNE